MFPEGWDNMTWDDMLRLAAELQAQQLQFYLPVNDLGANALNPIFISLLYQYGGELYSSNNMESGLKSEAAMDAFEFWTELYTNYSFPTSASFLNRFRTGEMPIGISYYEMYNSLSVFAPELKGKWSFHLIPGTQVLDADGNPVKDKDGKAVIDHTATASGTGAVLMKQEVCDIVNGEVQINNQGYAAWTFLKWWTNAETQRQFGVEMEGILGSAARHATANVKALQQLAWPQEDLDMLLTQWSTVHEMPQIAGSYITGRELENAFREVINNLYNARETLYEYSILIDAEINRKRSEFGLPLLEDEQ
jgi:ABC-type glycerol-3-phosphate transport system substrate-binding protein